LSRIVLKSTELSNAWRDGPQWAGRSFARPVGTIESGGLPTFANPIANVAPISAVRGLPCVTANIGRTSSVQN
jgi:hypothetical protein